ncbi:ras-domain-containing protein [Terfezia boudieri ATCC MYA-4762]|uniref:Ras-domain-containing protein n=1 Tax=Terfezia boudieri ATCC MYA-4762 TaxID=1051890 RepID=A0A3N4M036_9PEZI|nr:ras-domain-containing protein [Terfezia boudieri ATCC MYA-4762]
MTQPWDYIAKVVNIGDSACGKTSLTLRLCEGRFQPQHNVTIGVEFGSRVIPLPPVPTDPTKPPDLVSNPLYTPKIKLQIWDTAGQETFRSITRSYFRGCAGAIIVYDVTRRSTFANAGMWLEELKKAEGEGYAGDNGAGMGEGGGVSVILVGNKKDLQNGATGGNSKRRREVSYEEARTWAEDNEIKYFVETSAKSGEGVEEVFVAVARDIYERIKAGRVVVGGKGSGVKGPPGRNNNNRIMDIYGKGRGRGRGGCC